MYTKIIKLIIALHLKKLVYIQILAVSLIKHTNYDLLILIFTQKIQLTWQNTTQFPI